MAKASAKKVGLTEQLEQLSDAFEVAEAKKEALAQAHQDQTAAVADAKAIYDAVVADYQSRVQAAAQASDEARTALEALRQSVNDRVGTLTGQSSDVRVSVK